MAYCLAAALCLGVIVPAAVWQDRQSLAEIADVALASGTLAEYAKGAYRTLALAERERVGAKKTK
jgi:hypothetical protein